jgi:uncharacterized protein
MRKKTNRLRPDKHVRRLLEIDPKSLGRYQAVLLDYDNTLAPWRMPLSEKTIAWLKALPVPAHVLSNGGGKRIRETMTPLGVGCRGRCRKPLTGPITRYLAEQKLDPRRCVFIGDNLLTDIWTGNRLGCATIKVEPMSPREHPGTIIWRLLECLLGDAGIKSRSGKKR